LRNDDVVAERINCTIGLARLMRGFGLRTLAGKIGWAMTARPLKVSWPGGVVSFTFDDFPKSAIVGGRVLERHGARGTFYTAMQLAGTNDILGPMFDHEDILTAHRTGHEIACHTFTHCDLRYANRSTMLAEICENATALSSLIKGFIPTNFAYPYGRLSLKAKYVMGSRFTSCRGIGGRINHGVADLADLPAKTLYSADFDEAEIRRLIDDNSSVNGWLIFFTHDVVEVPSPFGCTPSQLGAVVAYAAERTTILPVRDVIAGLGGAPRNSLLSTAWFLFVLAKIVNLCLARLRRGSFS
jgi:peptidoglycan/xylan/chitin deacetylase (PgdA/CDA1 family)